MMAENEETRRQTFPRNVSTEMAQATPVSCDSVSNPSPERVGGLQRPKANSLGTIVGQFKGASTKRIWAQGSREFAWQSGFYDHVIRDDADLDRIRTYIENNPLKWDLDELNDGGDRRTHS